MYEAAADPYCYPGTPFSSTSWDLESRASLTPSKLRSRRSARRSRCPPALLARQYRAIHRHLFQDVYPWAGKLRTVRISKEGSAFCYPEHIDREMRRLFANLATRKHFRELDAAAFSESAAHFLADLNAIHPFREGNGRTQLSFLTVLADRAGHPLHLEQLDPKAMLSALIASFRRSEKALAKSIGELLR
jgi:cell filamentation protein